MSSKALIISGATATGKTELSLRVSKSLASRGVKSAIINFDSLLFYKDLNIGVAKPSREDLEIVPHKMINLIDLSDSMDASQYVKNATPIFKELLRSNYVPILVGGSAFYLRAFIKGMYDSKKSSPDNLKEWNDIYEKKGIDPFIDFLQKEDPEIFNFIHHHDHYRVIRAFAHHKETGRSWREERVKIKNPYDFSNHRFSDVNFLHFYLQIPKDDHWSIIYKRAEKMIAEGLIDEVQSLVKHVADIHLQPLQSIGYKETLEYLNNDMEKRELIEKIYVATRKLAKSQKTFFKKISPKVTVDPRFDKLKVLDNTFNFLFR